MYKGNPYRIDPKKFKRSKEEKLLTNADLSPERKNEMMALSGGRNLLKLKYQRGEGVKQNESNHNNI